MQQAVRLLVLLPVEKGKDLLVQLPWQAPQPSVLQSEQRLVSKGQAVRMILPELIWAQSTQQAMQLLVLLLPEKGKDSSRTSTTVSLPSGLAHFRIHNNNHPRCDWAKLPLWQLDTSS